MTSRALGILIIAALACRAERTDERSAQGGGAPPPGAAADAAVFAAQAAKVADSQASDPPAHADSVAKAEADPEANSDAALPPLPQSPPIGRSSQQLGLAAAVLTRLPELRSGMTLGEWRRLEPLESVEPYRAGAIGYADDAWCARVAGESALDSARVVSRTASFYIPLPPESLALPTGVPADDLLAQCRLGALSAALVVRDAFVAAQLGAETAAALGAALPERVKEPEVWLPGSGSWQGTTLWTSGGLAAVTAVDPNAGPRRGSGLNAVRIVAVGTASRIQLDRPRFPPREPSYETSIERSRRRRTRIEEAIELAGLGGPEQSRLRAALPRLFEAFAEPKPYADAERTALVEAIVQSLDRSSELPAARGAASYLAADLILVEAMRPAGLDEEGLDAQRAALEKYGAAFEHSHLGGMFVYTRSWAKQALRDAPRSRAGEIAFLTLMEEGFETSAGCSDQDGKGFRAVIARGEQHIAENPGSTINAEVHTLVAQAYSDIVRLANGGAYQSEERAEYVGEAEAARALAIRHYQAALAKGLAGPVARDAWTHAWRLMAGLIPTRTWFYCVYD